MPALGGVVCCKCGRPSHGGTPISEEPTSEAWEALVLVMLGADGLSQGASCIEVSGAGPQLGDGAKGLLQDLVKRDTGIDVLKSAAPGDAAPALGCLGTVGLRVSRPCSPGFKPPPIE
jgi:hypothetical protein